MKIKIESRLLYNFNKTHVDNILNFSLTKYMEICNKNYYNSNYVSRFMVAFKFPETPAMFNRGEYLIDNKEDLNYAKYLRTLYFRAKGLKTACKRIQDSDQMLWLDEFETDCYNFCVDFIS